MVIIILAGSQKHVEDFVKTHKILRNEYIYASDMDKIKGIRLSKYDVYVTYGRWYDTTNVNAILDKLKLDHVSIIQNNMIKWYLRVMRIKNGWYKFLLKKKITRKAKR